MEATRHTRYTGIWQTFAMGLANWIPKGYPWRVAIFDKNGKNDDNSENLANNRKRVGEKLNEITRGAPYKVAKLMKMANLIN